MANDKMMHGVILRGPEHVTYEEVPVPDVGPGDLLIKVEAALTCGTDLKVFLRGGHPRMIKVPAVFGHEMAGTIAKAGRDVEGFKEGDRVVPSNSAPCGECWCCEKDMPNLCEDMLYINGAFAEYALIPERIVRKNLHLIPENISFGEAAMTEPLACAMHGSDAAGVSNGDTVLLCGAGPLGLMFIARLKAAGIHVIVAEPVRERQEAARKVGADEIVTPGEGGSLSGAVIKMTEGGRGVDAAIDATGVPAVWQECVTAVRKGGTAVLFGGAAPGTTVTFDTKKVHYDQITIKGLYHHTPVYIKSALDFISKHADILKPIITTTLPLSETESALRMMEERRALKVEIRNVG